MPARFKSKAQAAAFHAAAAGHGTSGIPASVAKRAVLENAGKKLKGLPRYVRTRHRLKGGKR